MFKDKKGEGNLGMIIMLFIGIIVIVSAFLPAIFSSQSEMTTKAVATNEVVSVATAKLASGNFNASVNLPAVTNAPTGWKVTGCPLSSVVVTNASGTVLTVTNDYTFSATTGVLNVKNTTATVNAFASNNNSLIDYTHCLDGYNTNAGARGMANLIGIGAVLALLAFIITGLKYDWFN